MSKEWIDEHFVIIAYFNAFISVTLILACMYNAYNELNPREHRGPPVWGPHMQDRFPFRTWTREVMLWSIREDMPVARKAAWVATNLRGGAKALIDTLPPQAIIHGGQINGQQVDPMTFILHSLSERYSPLGEETRMQATQDLLNFTAEPREKIDDLLTRFDIVRHRAETEGNLGMNIQTISELLLRACRLNEEQLLRMLEPTQGLPPRTDQEFTAMCTRLRRMGHIVEGSTGNIASLLRSNRGHSTYFSGYGQDPTGSAISQAPVNTTYMMGDYTSPWTHRDYDPFTNTSPVYYDANDGELDSGTDSDTISSIGDTVHPEPAGPPERHGQDIFWAYQQAKSRWRKYSGKPTRKVRRFVRKKGKSKGKGRLPFRGKTSISTYLARTAEAGALETVFLQKGKGKGKHSKSTGLGFGRKKNPKDRNGKTMECHGCGSDEHLIADCNKHSTPALLAAASSSRSVGYASNQLHDDHSWFGWVEPSEARSDSSRNIMPPEAMDDFEEGPLAGVITEARSDAAHILMINQASSGHGTPIDPLQQADPWQSQQWFQGTGQRLPPSSSSTTDNLGTAAGTQSAFTANTPANVVRTADYTYNIMPGAQVVQMIPAVAQVEMPAFTTHPQFSYLGRNEHRPYNTDSQLTPLWSGATGGMAPSTLDTLQQEATLNMQFVQAQMSLSESERTRPPSQITAATIRNQSEIHEKTLEEFCMIQEYSEEQRKLKEAKGKGKSRHRPMPSDPIPPMSPELTSMQRNLQERQGAGADYLGDNSQCSFCLMDFDHGEIVVRLTCRHMFHTECINDYAAHGQRQTQEAIAAGMPPPYPECPNCRGSAQIASRFRFIAPDSDNESHHTAASSVSRPQQALARPQPTLPWNPADNRPQPPGYYHAKTALSTGAPALLVDIGAWTNVGGVDRGKEAALAAVQAGYTPKQSKMDCPLEIQGVGNGTQKGEYKATIPVALMKEDGEATLFDYEVPLIDKDPKVPHSTGHQLPLIVGLKSLKAKRAVLELEDGKEMLTFPGPGGYTINWSPGTVRLPMSKAMSGHLMVSCAHYDQVPQKPGGVEKAIPTLPVVPENKPTNSDVFESPRQRATLPH